MEASDRSQIVTSIHLRLPRGLGELDLHSRNAYNACMSNIQYTIRSVPEHVDDALRRMAAEHRISLNAAAVKALERGLGLEGEPVIHHDLDFLAGSWEDDPEFDRAMEEFERIDEEMWR